MSVVSRGVRNAFRNSIRTTSIVVLLGVSMGMALVMLLANQAVKTKISDLKENSATILTLNPAGAFGPSEGGGEPLTTDDTAKIKNLEHVSDTGQVLLAGGGMIRISAGQQPQIPESQVSLESSIELGTIGNRRFGVTANSPNGNTTPPKLPVNVIGLDGDLGRDGTPLKMTAGTSSFSGSDVYEAILGKGIADKNKMSVGSTFTGFKQTFRVVGIYDAGNEFQNDGVLVPLATAQRLNDRGKEVSEILVKVDSIDNLDTVKSAIKSKLGSDRVDINSSAQNIQEALDALSTIQSVSLTGALVALGASALVLLLVMIIIVRERRREIGVLKAIGASNFKVVFQFVSEAVVLTALGLFVGFGLAVMAGGRVTSALVSNQIAQSDSGSDSSSNEGPRMISGPSGAGSASLSTSGQRGGGFRNVARFGGRQVESAKQLVAGVQTSFGATTILEGLGLIFLIAGLGSAVPAFLISKVRPAEVMRAE